MGYKKQREDEDYSNAAKLSPVRSCAQVAHGWCHLSDGREIPTESVSSPINGLSPTKPDLRALAILHSLAIFEGLDRP